MSYNMGPLKGPLRTQLSEILQTSTQIPQFQKIRKIKCKIYSMAMSRASVVLKFLLATGSNIYAPLN